MVCKLSILNRAITFVFLLLFNCLSLAGNAVDYNGSATKEIKFNKLPFWDENVIDSGPFVVVQNTKNGYVIESRLSSLKLNEKYINAQAYYSKFMLPSIDNNKYLNSLKYSYAFLLEIPKDKYALLTIESTLWSESYIGIIEAFSFNDENYDRIVKVDENPIRLIGNVLQEDAKYIAVVYNPIAYSSEGHFFRFATRVRFRLDLYSLATSKLNRPECDDFYDQKLDLYLSDNCYFNDIVSTFRRVLF